MRRGFWFVAGASAGVYAVYRARRAAEAFTPDGLRDRVAGLGVGAHLFADEVRAGMADRENELRERLGLALDGPRELGARPVSTSDEPGGAPGSLSSSNDELEVAVHRSSTTDVMEGTH